MSPYFTTKCFWCPINELSKAVTTIAFGSHLICSHIFTKNSKLFKISVHHVRRPYPQSHVFWVGKLLSWKWIMVISCWHLFLDITVWVTVLCVRNTSRFLKWNNSLRQSGKILVHYCLHSMSMRIHLRHYCLNMTTCRWPPRHSVHFCSRNGKAVITHCSISLGIPWIHSRNFLFLGHQFWHDMFHIPCF